MKAATILPTHKIVPAGEGTLVQPMADYDGVFNCIFWTVGTAWQRLLLCDEVPSFSACRADFNAHPGKWVCIGNNR